MRRSACSLPPSCWTSTSSSAAFSSVSSAASTSSVGSCYEPPSWTTTTPRPDGKKNSKKKRNKSNKCTRTKINAGAGGAVAVARMNSSVYRGVTRHKASGKFEAHLWDKDSWSPTSKKRGRQVYLGAYDSEEAAARTYDLASLKYWGSGSVLNFPVESYVQEREKMKRLTREGYLATLRRRSSGFSRGVSEYRGVAKHHLKGKWEARIGHAGGKKYVYLGTFGSQEEAARAYDLAALELRGRSAVTNFDISSYLQPPGPKAQPEPVLRLKDEPIDEASPLSRAQPAPLLQPKPEPEDDEHDPAAVALPLGPALLDAHDVDRAIAEILPALCMDPADFEARYPARAPPSGCSQCDDLRGLSLPDSVRFEDDVEALFDAAHDETASRAEDAVSYAAATAISSLASGRWL